MSKDYLIKYCPPDATDFYWTPEEEALLREFYGKIRNAELKKKLPGRTQKAMEAHAERLGLVLNTPDWTDAEKQVLREKYPGSSNAEIIAALPGKSGKAIRIMASRLGIKKRAWESPRKGLKTAAPYEHINCYCSGDEKKSLQKAAEKAGKRLSRFIIDAALEKAKGA